MSNPTSSGSDIVEGELDAGPTKSQEVIDDGRVVVLEFLRLDDFQGDQAGRQPGLSDDLDNPIGEVLDLEIRRQDVDRDLEPGGDILPNQALVAGLPQGLQVVAQELPHSGALERGGIGDEYFDFARIPPDGEQRLEAQCQ
jgi:hypothetical protein